VILADTLGAPTLKVDTDPRSGQRYYTYPPTDEQFISVTTVAGMTTAKPWLGPWFTAEGAAWLEENHAEVAAMSPHDAAEALKKAVKARTEIKADAGSHVHDVAESLIIWARLPERYGAAMSLPELPEHLRGARYDGEPIEHVVDAMIAGFEGFVDRFEPQFVAAEMTVFNVELELAGTLDGLAIFHDCDLDKLHRLRFKAGSTLRPIIDWKTGAHEGPEFYEQLAGLESCTEAWIKGRGLMVERPLTDSAAILRLRPEFPAGHRLMFVSEADRQAGYDRLVGRLAHINSLRGVRPKVGRVSLPVSAENPSPSPRLCDLDGEGFGRAPGALAKALGRETTLADLAHFSEAELLALRNVGVVSRDQAVAMLAAYGLRLRDHIETKGVDDAAA
jgi:hypothetical protein